MNAPRTRINRHTAAFLTAMALFLGVTNQASAQQESTPQQIPRIDSRIAVDGVLDESVWEQAWSMTLDYEVRPGENTPAPVETEVLVYHDQQRLYVGFRAFDPDPSSIRAHLSDRDQSWACLLYTSPSPRDLN